jgi:hypothetical protein
VSDPPLVSAIGPAVPEPGDKVQVLVLTGTRLEPELTIELTDPTDQTQSYMGDQIVHRSPTEVHASVMLPVEGRYALTAINRNGERSEPFPFEVKTPPRPAPPVITEIRPPDPRPSPEAQRLTVRGRGFEQRLRVTVTDPAGVELTDVTTRNVMPDAFDLMVRLSTPGDYLVVVTNPSGGVSNAHVLTVQTPTSLGWRPGGRCP